MKLLLNQNLSRRSIPVTEAYRQYPGWAAGPGLHRRHP